MVLRSEDSRWCGREDRHAHTLVTTSANVVNSTMLPDLLHGQKRKVWGEGDYQGKTAAIREAAPKAQDMTRAEQGSSTMWTSYKRKSIGASPGSGRRRSMCSV